jgi:hypothetical protein
MIKTKKEYSPISKIEVEEYLAIEKAKYIDNNEYTEFDKSEIISNIVDVLVLGLPIHLTIIQIFMILAHIY